MHASTLAVLIGIEEGLHHAVAGVIHRRGTRGTSDLMMGLFIGNLVLVFLSFIFAGAG